MSIEIGALLTGLLGGLALFLFGMDQLTVALKSVAGARMKSFLVRITGNRFKSAFAGAFITSVIQSSSITTVLVVGFISAGLLTLQQSIGIIMGANVGATITAQIVAFKITHYALFLVAAGTAGYLFSRREQVRHLGLLLIGLGLLFFGMDMMSEATSMLRSFAPFTDAMRTMQSPLYGILIAAAFTAVIQSSSATTGLIIVLAGQGYLTLEAGIALAFGANIGTCVTALFAAIGKHVEAVRASVVHILFNVVGVAIWYAFIGDLAELVRIISPSSPELQGFAKLAADTPRQIANAHTVFNVANTLIFIGFVGPIATLVSWIVPKREIESEPGLSAKYLDDILLDAPDLALDRVHRELMRIGRRTLSMVMRAGPLVEHGSETQLSELAGLDDDVDALHRQIVRYLGSLATRNLNQRQSSLAALYMIVNNNLESIADLVAVNMVHSGMVREREAITFSDRTQDMLQQLHEFVTENLGQVLTALDGLDASRAKTVVDAKGRVTQLASDLEDHLSARLAVDAEAHVATFRLEVELVEYMKRIYYLTKRMARELVHCTEQNPTDGHSASR